MINLREHLGWLCSASLWCGTAAWAEEPAPFYPTTDGSDQLDVAKRFEQLQQRLDRLEAENGQLRQSMFQSQNGQGGGVTPANATLWNANADAACPPACQCPVCAAEKNGKGDWKTGWNNGIEWMSPDKAFKAHVGGRTQFDSVWYQAEAGALTGAGGLGSQDGVGFRRARIRVDGTIYESIEYVTEWDFVNTTNANPGVAGAPGATTENNIINVTAPTDVWVRFKDIPLIGNIQVGNIKEPIGFEHLTSSRYLNFMERSFNQDLFTGAFNNGFTPGIMAHNTYAEEHGTWAVGLYKNTANIYAWNVGDGEGAVTGRVTYLPLLDEECHQLIHIGLSGSSRDPDQNRVRYRTRDMRQGNGSLATVFADTGFFTASQAYFAGAELVGVNGPLSFQAEWIGAWSTNAVSQSSTASAATGTALGTVYVQNFYVEGHYFLTGETREYEKKAGAFGRVIPLKNARWKGGCYEPGAWQLAFRYDHADLNDSGVDGGRLNSYTFGVNWFLNPNMKVQANYALTERDRGISQVQAATVDNGLIHGFGMRLAYDF
ncbi:hypothetical protein LBMAG52_30290 [Planctomycetia bacterium]|nr:hypothetical protein LBMAG52_30290 [Planctomycetia bacterium]